MESVWLIDRAPKLKDWDSSYRHNPPHSHWITIQKWAFVYSCCCLFSRFAFISVRSFQTKTIQKDSSCSWSSNHTGVAASQLQPYITFCLCNMLDHQVVQKFGPSHKAQSSNIVWFFLDFHRKMLLFHNLQNRPRISLLSLLQNRFREGWGPAQIGPGLRQTRPRPFSTPGKEREKGGY